MPTAATTNANSDRSLISKQGHSTPLHLNSTGPWSRAWGPLLIAADACRPLCLWGTPQLLGYAGAEAFHLNRAHHCLINSIAAAYRNGTHSRKTDSWCLLTLALRIAFSARSMMSLIGAPSETLT